MQRLYIAEYFDSLGKSQKVYSKFQEPVCKKWEVTRNELDVLLFLYNNPEYDRAADIVFRRGIAKSHVSLSVANLEGRGMLSKQFDPEDRRTARLKLTEMGCAAARDGKKAQQSFLSQLHTGITEDELKAWMEVTQKIWKNINNMESERT